MPTNHRWTLLPGLGADARLLDPQRQAISDLYVPNWLMPHRGESLPAYATRFMATFPSTPEILGGVSLGGMIALEMARFCRPKALVLIASCRTGHAVFRPARFLRPIFPIIPSIAMRAAQWSSGFAASICGLPFLLGTTREQQQLCTDMFKHADPKFVLWGLKAIMDWHPPPLENIPIWHIHGSRDRAIPVRYVTATEVIQDGAHLINLSHTEQVNDFLQQVDRSLDDCENSCYRTTPTPK